jgi:putative oxidoreductase
MIKKMFSTEYWSVNSADCASLILRLSLGLMMLNHGLPKLMNLFGNGAIRFGNPLGIGVTASLILVVFAEVVCSILVALGFFTRWAIIPIIITMIVALVTVHWHDGMDKKEGALMYLLPYIALFLLGSGKYSVDAILKRKA